MQVKIRLAEEEDAELVENVLGDWLKRRIERAEAFRKALGERVTSA
jgi:hypothetical protein